jgi:predicted Zn-dependent protease
MGLRIPTAARRRLGGLATSLLLSVSAGCASFGGGPAMSLQQEQQVGRQAQAEVARQMDISRDPVVVNYIRGVGERIVAANELREFDYTFDVVNSPQVNAFAIPGGHLYVNTGLICTAGSEDELAGVMGHEIGHAAKRHAVTQLSAQQQAQAAAMGGAALLTILLGGDPGKINPVAALPAMVAAQGFLLKYSRDHEREADQLAVQYLHRAGYDPRGVPSFFEKLAAEDKSRPSGLTALLSTHPVTSNRIAATRAAAERIGPPRPLSGAAGGTGDLRRIQAHLNCEQLLARAKQEPPRPSPDGTSERPDGQRLQMQRGPDGSQRVIIIERRR